MNRPFTCLTLLCSCHRSLSPCPRVPFRSHLLVLHTVTHSLIFVCPVSDLPAVDAAGAVLDDIVHVDSADESTAVVVGDDQ